MSVKKIISGGQTGADRAGWIAAKQLGLETGGMLPKGFRAEDGLHPEFAELYNAKESPNEAYAPRTAANVNTSDGTIIFGNSYSPGSKLTIDLCNKNRKPTFRIPVSELNALELISLESFREWLFINKIEILNVAGNRESKMPGIQDYVTRFLVAALKENKEPEK